MSPKRNRLAWVDLQKVEEGWDLDMVPFGGEGWFRAQQLPNSGRTVVGPFSMVDLRTLRDVLTRRLSEERRGS